jgi:Glycosyltransferase family 87
VLKYINHWITALCLLITSFWGLKIALLENHHEDLLIYTAGAGFALEGRSLYDRDALRAAVTAQYPQDDRLQENSGFFLAPQSVLLLLPFNVFEFQTRKIVWYFFTIGLFTAAVICLPKLLEHLEPIWLCGITLIVVMLQPMAQFVFLVGQTTLLMFSLIVFGELLYRKGWHRIGNLLWALAFFKPHIALVLLPLAFVLNGWKRTVEIVGWAALLNLLVGVVFYRNPLYVLEYLKCVQGDHKSVKFNLVSENAHILSWNRLYVALTKKSLELNITTTVIGYVLYWGLAAGVRSLAGPRDPLFLRMWWLAVAGASVTCCCQLLPYEITLFFLALPHAVLTFLYGNWRLGIGLCLCFSFSLINGGADSGYYWLLDATLTKGTPAFDFFESHRAIGTFALAVLVLLSYPPRKPLGEPGASATGVA